MYKVLVVDDEKWVRQGIRTTVDWAKYKVEEVFEARDGEEALEIVRVHKPDLIITDIKMPHLDGLEFIEEVRKSNELAKVIFISGYGEFEYAQRAIKLGAADYIMKPIEDSILEGIIDKCFSEIAEEKNKDLILTRSKDLVKECLPLAQSYYLNQLLHGEIADRDDINSRLKTLDIRLNTQSILVVSFYLDFLKGEGNTGMKNDELARFAVKNIIQEFYSKIGENYIIDISGQQMAVIISTDNVQTAKNRDRIRNFTGSILKVVKRFFKYEVTAGMGSLCTIQTAANSYKGSLDALEYRFLSGGGAVYDVENIKSYPRTAMNDILTLNLEILTNYLKLGDEEKALEMIQNLFDRIASNRDQLKPGEVKAFLAGIVMKVNEGLQKENPAIAEIIPGSSDMAGFISAVTTLKETHKYIADFMTTYLSFFSQNLNRKKKVVDDALKYISEHYNQDIAMNSVAQALFLNASYFSKIFREQVGATYSEYLTRIRMESAKELLKESYLKVYEIAERVGYSDYRHFTKKFKETQGISPGEYREGIQ
jgi:two-component system, response regulator YesN